ncbi:MAG TPA: RNA polymerase sigma factor SigY [Clostridiaceae bacterium]
MDEISLVEEAKKGSRNALNQLLTENYSIVKGYIVKMTGDPNLAQDIIQETMLRACVNISKFKPNAKFSTWLITIATNVYRDMLRKKHPMELIEETLETKEVGPEEAFQIKAEYKEALDILLSLPYKKRSVFILKHYYGYKYEEIAQILSCPIGTVRSRLHNCIEYIVSEMERRELING